MNKNKNFLKKAFAIATSVIMGFGSAAVPVHADTVDSAGTTGYWFYGPGLFIEGNWDNSGAVEKNEMYMYNGVASYCVEPKVRVMTGSDVYDTSKLQDSNFQTAAIRDKITKITYFGYNYPGHGDTSWYIATQKAVWTALDSSYGSVETYTSTAKADAAGMIYPGDSSYCTDVSGTIDAEVAEINSLVADYETKNVAPNFVITDENGVQKGTSGQSASFDKALIGKTYTVTDTSGGLSAKYADINDFGSNAVIDGNTVKITMTKSDLNVNHVIDFFTKGEYNLVQGAPIILATDDPKAQTIVMPGSLDPNHGKITLEGYGYNLKLKKQDADTHGRTQGDVPDYKDVSYEIFSKDDNEVVGTLTTDANGDSNILEGLAPGNYTYTEKSTVDGYNLDSVSHDFTISDSDYVITAEDTVETGKLSIHKLIPDTEESDFTKPEKGATFEAILTKYVTQYGSFEEAMKHTADYTKKEWSVFVTDDDGNATSGDLAYGDYTVKQIASSNTNVGLLKQEFHFTVKKQGDSQNYEISNLIAKFYLRIDKKDLDSKKNVTADGADFKIYQLYDADGKEVNKYVTQQVGSTVYSVFRTNSDMKDSDLPDGTFYSKDEVTGTAVAPLKLEAGVYRIEETKTPYGYVLPENPVTVTLSNDTVTENINGNNYVEADVYNKMITGTLNVTKQLEPITDDEDLTSKDFTKVKFAIVAKEDINSVLDGSPIVKAGETYKEFNLDAEAKASITGIPLGSYTLVEEEVDKGMIKAAPVDFTVEEIDNKTPIITIAEPITNKVTHTLFSKTDITGENEIAGAELSVIDENGKTVTSWTSDAAKPHSIAGLVAGSTYTLKETSAPDGYYYSTDVTFKVNEDETINKVNMIDNMIHYRIAKVDDNGNYVKGVTLKLTDTTADAAVTLPNNGITTDEPFELDGKLIAGHKYLLEESEYVAGVYKATSVEFEVAKTGTADVTTITMKDLTTNIAIQKVDNHGNPVAGAKLQILETTTDKDGNIVPAADKDGKAIVVKEYTSTSDAAGIDISKDVMGDKTYILRESEAPFGFDLSKDVTFTVTGTKEKAQVIMMTDVRKTYYVSAVKVDAQDPTNLLPGAEITLFLQDGTVAKDINGNDCKGTTDGQGFITWNVEYNGDFSGYYVQETAAPLGYRINSNHYDVTLSENYDFAKDNAIKIVVNDEAAPIDTGVEAPIIWCAVGAASMFALLVILKNRRSKNRAD